MHSFTGVLEYKHKLNNQVLLTRYRLDEPLLFNPGQFVAIDIKGVKRFYSIASPPESNNKIELISAIDSQGIGRSFFKGVKIGETLSFLGPEGNFILKNSPKPKIFLATGVGIAPIRSMIRHLCNNDFANQFCLFWGIRNASDTFLEREWKIINQSLPQFQYFYSLSQETHPDHLKGYVQFNLNQVLTSQNLNPLDFEYYVCGAVDTVKHIVDYLEQTMLIPTHSISFEKFT